MKRQHPSQSAVLRTNYTTISSSITEPLDHDGLRSARITISQPKEIFGDCENAEMILSKMSIPISGIPLMQVELNKSNPGPDQNRCFNCSGVIYPGFYALSNPAYNDQLWTGNNQFIWSTKIPGKVKVTTIPEQAQVIDTQRWDRILDEGTIWLNNSAEVGKHFAGLIKNAILTTSYGPAQTTPPTGMLAPNTLVNVDVGFSSDSMGIDISFNGTYATEFDFYGPIFGGVMFPFNDGNVVKIQMKENCYYLPAFQLVVSASIKNNFPFLEWTDCYSLPAKTLVANPGYNTQYPATDYGQYYVWRSDHLVPEISQITINGETFTRIHVNVPSCNIANSTCFAGLAVEAPFLPIVPQYYPLFQRMAGEQSVNTTNLSITTKPLFEIYLPLIGKASDLDGFLVVNKDSLNVNAPIPIDVKQLIALRDFYFDFYWIDNYGQLHPLKIPPHQNIFLQLTWFIS